jgi:hypothetical protein
MAIIVVFYNLGWFKKFFSTFFHFGQYIPVSSRLAVSSVVPGGKGSWQGYMDFSILERGLLLHGPNLNRIFNIVSTEKTISDIYCIE